MTNKYRLTLNLFLFALAVLVCAGCATSDLAAYDKALRDSRILTPASLQYRTLADASERHLAYSPLRASNIRTWREIADAAQAMEERRITPQEFERIRNEASTAMRLRNQAYFAQESQLEAQANPGQKPARAGQGGAQCMASIEAGLIRTRCTD